MKNVIFAVCFLTFCRTIPKKPRKKVIFDNKTQHQITVKYRAKNAKKFFKLFPSKHPRKLFIPLITLTTKATEQPLDETEKVRKSLESIIKKEFEIKITDVKKTTSSNDSYIVLNYIFTVTNGSPLKQTQEGIYTIVEKLNIHEGEIKKNDFSLKVLVAKDPLESHDLAKKAKTSIDKLINKDDLKFKFEIEVK